MKKRTRSIEQIIEEQMQRWQIMRTEKAEVESEISIVTMSREPGSGGRIVAQRLAADLGFEVFHQEVIHMMADDAKISKKLLESLDEKGLTILEDWISSLVYDRHLWPDQYLKHLMRVIMTIGRHGHAVIVGRGANFVLPQQKRFSVRIVLPREQRIRNVAQNFDIPPEEATGLNEQLHRVGMDNIFLIAPTTPDDRVARIV